MRTSEFHNSALVRNTKTSWTIVALAITVVAANMVLLVRTIA